MSDDASFLTGRRGLATTFKRLVRRIVLPNNAISGQMRIEVGADTPPELQAYGVANAILGYVTDKTSLLELGYFFIGISNSLDGGANQKILLFGNVRYPVDGDPSSPTSANVKTAHQINLFNTEIAGTGFTIFKDHNIVIRSTVAQINIASPNTYWTGDNIFVGMPDGSDPCAFVITPGSELRLDPTGAFNIDGFSQGRGYVCDATSNVNSAAIGAEAVVLTTNAGTFRDGRVFKAILNAGYFGSVANNALIRVRRGTTTAGTALWTLRTPPIQLAAATAQMPFEMIWMNNTGADITDQVCVTIQASAGTVTQTGSGGGQRYFHVTDHGSTAQYGTGWVSL